MILLDDDDADGDDNDDNGDDGDHDGNDDDDDDEDDGDDDDDDDADGDGDGDTGSACGHGVDTVLTDTAGANHPPDASKPPSGQARVGGADPDYLDACAAYTAVEVPFPPSRTVCPGHGVGAGSDAAILDGQPVCPGSESTARVTLANRHHARSGHAIAGAAVAAWGDSADNDEVWLLSVAAHSSLAVLYARAAAVAMLQHVPIDGVIASQPDNAAVSCVDAEEKGADASNSGAGGDATDGTSVVIPPSLWPTIQQLSRLVLFRGPCVPELLPATSHAAAESACHIPGNSSAMGTTADLASLFRAAKRQLAHRSSCLCGGVGSGCSALQWGVAWAPPPSWATLCYTRWCMASVDAWASASWELVVTPRAAAPAKPGAAVAPRPSPISPLSSSAADAARRALSAMVAAAAAQFDDARSVDEDCPETMWWNADGVSNHAPDAPPPHMVTGCPTALQPQQPRPPVKLSDADAVSRCNVAWAVWVLRAVLAAARRVVSAAAGSGDALHATTIMGAVCGLVGPRLLHHLARCAFTTRNVRTKAALFDVCARVVALHETASTAVRDMVVNDAEAGGSPSGDGDVPGASTGGALRTTTLVAHAWRLRRVLCVMNGLVALDGGRSPVHAASGFGGVSPTPRGATPAASTSFSAVTVVRSDGSPNATQPPSPSVVGVKAEGAVSVSSPRHLLSDRAMPSLRQRLRQLLAMRLVKERFTHTVASPYTRTVVSLLLAIESAERTLPTLTDRASLHTSTAAAGTGTPPPSDAEVLQALRISGACPLLVGVDVVCAV